MKNEKFLNPKLDIPDRSDVTLEVVSVEWSQHVPKIILYGHSERNTAFQFEYIYYSVPIWEYYSVY